MMDQKTKAKLHEINQVFYERFSGSFSATRNQVQPGVYRLIQRVKPEGTVLDIGCGNGTLARALLAQGFYGQYLGVDMSAGLLSEAERLLKKSSAGIFNFQWLDLATSGWPNAISHKRNDWLFSFAVLHHLPGEDLRQQTVKAFRKLINPAGFIAVSVWQWQNSPRLRKRVLPWSTVGLEPRDLDPGDVLLDWRASETPGLRYVHTFDEKRLSSLAAVAGFNVNESFLSDGKSGDLALYQVWRIKPD